MSANVLIIDDEELDTFIAKITLTNILSDVNISTCKNGLKALQSLRKLVVSNPQNLPDYIFLDLSMPVMDGFEFLDEYNNLSLDNTRTTKIYVLSSSIFTDDIKKTLENSSVSGFLSKPIDSNKVKDIFNLN
ncbi:response regulator [Mucilaginibacter sp.]